MGISKRRIALLAAWAVAVPLGGVAVMTTASAATTGCAVTYKITNQWQGGFGGDVTIANLGDPITEWTLTWSFTAGQSVTQAWNATVTQNGTAVTAENVSYNATIPAQGTANFGFNGSWTDSNPVPADFSLNGTSCTGSTTTPSSSSVSSNSPCPSASSDSPASPSTGASASSTPATTEKITIWMAGDSTMQNATTCPIGWGSQFGAYFTSDVTVVNSAVGGRSIQTWMYDPNVTTTMGSDGECVISPETYSSRWQAMLDPTTGMQAGDYLLIQFGINDGSTTCNRHVGSARYQELLGVMARAAQERGAHPIFLTPVAAITCSGSTAVGNRGFLTETVNAGTANGVPVVDLHARSLALYNALGLCPNGGDYTTGAVGAFFCNDHTHFEAEGANQIAGVVATAIRDQDIPLASYLR